MPQQNKSINGFSLILIFIFFMPMPGILWLKSSILTAWELYYCKNILSATLIINKRFEEALVPTNSWRVPSEELVPMSPRNYWKLKFVSKKLSITHHFLIRRCRCWSFILSGKINCQKFYRSDWRGKNGLGKSLPIT